jgi:hypothetical protein
MELNHVDLQVSDVAHARELFGTQGRGPRAARPDVNSELR